MYSEYEATLREQKMTSTPVHRRIFKGEETVVPALMLPFFADAALANEQTLRSLYSPF